MEEESYESSRKGSAGTAGPNYPCAAKGKAAGKREEELDEEVDEFYALLGNLRALKDLFRRQHGDAGGCSTSRKRLRTEEEAPLPTWKPTFQLEDFKRPSGDEKEEEGKLTKDEENYMEQRRLEDGACLDLSLAL